MKITRFIGNSVHKNISVSKMDNSDEHMSDVDSEIDFDEDLPIQEDIFEPDVENFEVIITEDDLDDINLDDDDVPDIPCIVNVDEKTINSEDGFQYSVVEENCKVSITSPKSPVKKNVKSFECPKCSKLYCRESFFKKHVEKCQGI